MFEEQGSLGRFLATRHTFRGNPMSLSDEDLASLFHSPSKLRDLSDEDLMSALRMGCNDALALLFERYSSLAFRIARAILRDDGEAEETVQRVFLDIFKAVKQFNPDRGAFKTWFLQYVYHRTLDRVSIFMRIASTIGMSWTN
jgi:hypothetical protein